MTKLLVGNLWPSATEQQLRGAFATHGEIHQVALVLDRRTGKPRNFGYVTYVEREQAIEALGRMHESICFGQKITVRVAVESREKDSESGGEEDKGRGERGDGSSRARRRGSAGREENVGNSENGTGRRARGGR